MSADTSCERNVESPTFSSPVTVNSRLEDENARTVWASDTRDADAEGVVRISCNFKIIGAVKRERAVLVKIVGQAKFMWLVRRWRRKRPTRPSSPNPLRVNDVFRVNIGHPPHLPRRTRMSWA